MEKFTFEWHDSIKLNTVTPKWVMKLVVWSVIVAYLPNIIWYIAGYPFNAVILQLIVMTIGMPPIIIFSMRAYRRQYAKAPLKGTLFMDTMDVVIARVIMAQTFRRYIVVWKTRMSALKGITLDKDTGYFAIQSTWHVEAYARKRNGERGELVASEYLEKAVEVNMSADRIVELEQFLERHCTGVAKVILERECPPRLLQKAEQ